MNGNTVAFGYALDGVYGTGTQIAQSNAWEVSAFYEHYWTPAWRTSVFGNYSHIDYGSAGNALLTAAFTSTTAGLGTATSSVPVSFGTLNLNGATGNFALGLAQIGTRTAWTPVKDLTLSAEFTYSHIDQNLKGTYTATIAGQPASTVYTLGDTNTYSGAVQILRSF
jgi:hypothetical protein